MDANVAKRDLDFNSDQLQQYMNAGVPLSKESLANLREEKSSERRANLVLPKIFPQAFSISSYGGKRFGARASSIERSRGRNQRSSNKLHQGEDTFLNKLSKYKNRPKKLRGLRGNKRGTFMIVQEEDEDGKESREQFYSKRYFKRLSLQDMLAVVPLKNSGISGVTKKVLHAPSLQIFVVKEVPINLGRQFEWFDEKMLEKYVKRWQKHCFSNDSLVNIYDVMWNVPQGRLSIVYEHCSSGSLKALLQSVETLPEKALMTVAKQLLAALRLFHNKFFTNYNGLSTGQVLLDDELNLKLGLGLSKRLCYEKMLKKKEEARRNRSNHLMKSKVIRDSFEAGVVLLKCILGQLMEEIIVLLSKRTNGEIFFDSKDGRVELDQEVYDIFRILEHRKSKTMFKCREKLSEHYNSFYHLILGSARPHQKKPLIEAMLAKHPKELRILKFLQNSAAKKLKNYSKELRSFIKQLTQIDPEDRKTPEELLESDVFAVPQQRMNHTIFQNSLRKTFMANKENFLKDRFNFEPGGVCLEELVQINPDLGQKANDSDKVTQSSMFVDKILRSLKLMYKNGEIWYRLDDSPSSFKFENEEFEEFNQGTMRMASKTMVIRRTSSVIQELCRELGCEVDFFWRKLREMINQIREE